MSIEYPDEVKKLILRLVEARVIQHVSSESLKINNSLKRDFEGVFQEDDVNEFNSHFSCRATDAAFEELEKWCDLNSFSINDAVMLANRVYAMRIASNSSGQSGAPSEPSP